MFAFQMANKKGAWISLSDEIKEELTSKKIPFEEKFQGDQKFLAHLEDNEKLTKFLLKEFKSMVENAV